MPRPARIKSLAFRRAPCPSSCSSCAATPGNVPRPAGTKHAPNPHFVTGSMTLQWRIINGLELLTQISHIPFPVTMFAEPGERPGECRIEPAVRHPGRMVEHAERSQRLDQPDLPEIEIRELLIPLEQLRPLPLLIR